VPTLRIAQDAAADELLGRDPLALLIGMLLDQQFPMERAFGAPRLLADRLGVQSLSAVDLASADPEALVRVFQGPPALHRYPGSMAKRVHELCTRIVDEYGGDPAAVWTTARNGEQLYKGVRNLPGFGEQKARIFAALLGKQLGVRPEGWQEACGAYAEPGSYRSVADVVDPESLQKVRDFKKAAKAAVRADG
jgi:uncharacterized HhH-GPD family protein